MPTTRPPVLVGKVHQHLGALPGLAVFKGHVAARSHPARCPENGCGRCLAMSTLLERDAQLVGTESRHCCGCGPWCRSRAWSRPDHVGGGAVQHASWRRTVTSRARQLESSPPEMPTTAVLARVCSSRLVKAVRPACAKSPRSARRDLPRRAGTKGWGPRSGSAPCSTVRGKRTPPWCSRPARWSQSLVLRAPLAVQSADSPARSSANALAKGVVLSQERAVLGDEVVAGEHHVLECFPRRRRWRRGSRTAAVRSGLCTSERR